MRRFSILVHALNYVQAMYATQADFVGIIQLSLFSPNAPPPLSPCPSFAWRIYWGWVLPHCFYHRLCVCAACVHQPGFCVFICWLRWLEKTQWQSCNQLTLSRGACMRLIQLDTC